MGVCVIEDCEEVFVVFDKVLMGYVGFIILNFVCIKWLVLMNVCFISMLYKDEIVEFYCVVLCFSVLLVLMLDISMVVFGGLLKCKECIFVCLGDLLSYLYFVFVIFKCYNDEGCKKEDFVLV